MRADITPRGAQAGVAWPALLFGVPLLATAIWLLLTSGLIPILSWMEARDWAATSCHITDCHAEWNEERSIATLRVRYEYEVAGQVYEGDRHDFSNHRWDPKTIVDLLAQFPPDSDAICYVAPGEPSVSVLTQDYNGNYTGGCLLSGFLLIVGGLLTWIGIRWRMRSMTLAGNLMSPGD